MGFVIWLIALVAAAIGTVLANFIVSLNLVNLDSLISALVWFLIAFATYYAGKKIEDETWFKLVSINFMITWAFCTIGVLLGTVTWFLIGTGSISIQLDTMVNVFFISLPLTIGPTASMSLGLRNS